MSYRKNNKYYIITFYHEKQRREITVKIPVSIIVKYAMKSPTYQDAYMENSLGFPAQLAIKYFSKHGILNDINLSYMYSDAVADIEKMIKEVKQILGVI